MNRAMRRAAQNRGPNPELCDPDLAEALDKLNPGPAPMPRIAGTPRIEGFHEPHELPIKKGDKVLIRQGCTIKTTHPKRRPSYQAGRTYTITVHRVGCGRTDTKLDEDRTKVNLENPSVIWPGEGGYWCEVDINDVVPA